MRTRVLLLVYLMLSTIAFPLEAQTWNKVKDFFSGEETVKPMTIKVLIQAQSDGALVDVKGAYNVINPQNGSRVGLGFFGKNRFVQPNKGGLKWGEQYPDVFQISIVPDDHQTTSLVKGVEYRGAVTVYQIGDDKISIVNEVDLDDYIKSILAPQFDTPLSPEAMAAVAIAARTEAYYLVTSNKNSFWHVNARDVGYQGFAVTMRENGVDDAVDATRNLVLNHVVDGTDSPFPARFTGHSAGKTAPFQAVFRQEVPGPKEGVEAPLAARNRDDATWFFSVTREDLARIANFDRVVDLQIYKDKDSGKVHTIRFHDGKQSSDVDFLTLQESIGDDKLQSSDFSVAISGDHILFSGYGRGHGVGLCLYSADEMAKEGDNAAHILSTFFPGTELDLLQQESAAEEDVAQK